MRAAFAGGGSAGHLSPSLAVAQGFLRQAPGAEAVFLAANRPVDREVLAHYGLPHRLLSATGMPYGLSLRSLGSLARLAQGSLQAFAALGEWRPRVIFGAGGYISAAAIPAAALRGIPIVIHVSDAQPDRTNLRLARFARTITVAFAEAADHFPASKTVVTGQPVRDEILATDRAAARAQLGFGADDFVLLVTGGSQGARSLNQAVIEALPALGRAEVTVYHLTGGADHQRTVAVTREMALGQGYRCCEYESRMGLALAAADLVLMRAGSSSLAEAAAWGLPMILVPYPHAGGHQRQNARPLAASGAAVMIEDAELSGDRLAETVLALRRGDGERQAMAAAAHAWGARGAADRIAEHLLRAASL